MNHFSWGRARRPEETVEATRWVFAALVLGSLLFALPGVVALSSGPILLAGLISAGILALSWIGGYRRKSAPLWRDAMDAVAFLAFGLAGPEPIAILGLIMPALWFRSLYGSTRRAILRAGVFVAPLVAGVYLWPFVAGHPVGGLDAGVLPGVIPAMFLTVIASRQLAGGLQAREQAAQRDAVHMSAGSEFLGVTDAAEIRRIAWKATAGICAATPGLRVLKVIKEGARLRVEAATGGFAGVPASLPIEVVSLGSAGNATDAMPVFTHPDLNAAVGAPCVWACLPMPTAHTQHGYAWMLLGSPRKLSPEAIIAVGTLGNQVTLALHNGEVHEKLRLLAELDDLTGLANRASFNAALSAALLDASSEETTILFVDLDDFKDVNDLHGHAAGDALLREVAARLRETTRPGDLCARLGGDEFAVLLADTQAVTAAEVAERIVAAFRDSVPLVAGVARVGAGIGVRVGASIGVATAGGDTGLEELIHRADVAMYAAKAKGKGRIQIFERGLLRIDSAQVMFEQQLAAAADAHQLVVHYQPILSLADGRCTAVEALVRWQHPTAGLLYPGAFIEAAERTGAIRDIGAYVLRRACADTASWRDAHPDSALAVHVNVSALQLDDASFIDSVSGALAEFSLPAEQLVLEITETVVISSPVAIKHLNILAAQGVTIAIDDFGTGYSALTTLRSLPAQIVKIDKSFVAGCTENAQDRAVIEAIVKMAAQMGMRTVAEGVERPEQQKFLEGIRTDAVQGFLYLRPGAAEDFGAWLGAHLADRARTRQPGDVVIPLLPRAPQRSHSPAGELRVNGS